MRGLRMTHEGKSKVSEEGWGGWGRGLRMTHDGKSKVVGGDDDGTWSICTDDTVSGVPRYGMCTGTVSI